MNNVVPQVFDTARRVARTVIQAGLAIVSFAPIYPLIVGAIGAPKGSNLAGWLAASVVWVGSIAGAISRIMAIPAVNNLLAPVKLAAHSGTTLPGDSYTTALPILTGITSSNGSSEYSGDAAH